MSRGQALVELALAAPVAVALVLASAGSVEVAGAQAGLDAATQAAAEAAGRAPDEVMASAEAQDVFHRTVSGYPLEDAALELGIARFTRAGPAVVNASATVEIGFAGATFAPARLTLHSRAAFTFEEWRSHE